MATIELNEFVANDVCVIVMQALTFARQGRWEVTIERLRMALFILTGDDNELEEVNISAEEVQNAADWCGVDITDFIRIAIKDRLSGAQAAMEEEKVGTG